ncbi:PREDICTED: lymphocyte function-associated antigen 3, partial [Condylura cristata]|uniref:lymphocyte function-associated antigen 3 n=1 Tax=Condylura cristata TaxID=143302 RepID=UPI000643B300
MGNTGPVTCDPQLRSTVIYGGVDQAVTFRISGAAPLKDILWKQGKNKVIEWDEASLLEPRAFPPFLDRAALNTTSGDLTIYNLTSSDEGDYEVEYNSIKGDTKFELLVLELLPLTSEPHTAFIAPAAPSSPSPLSHGPDRFSIHVPLDISAAFATAKG